MTADVKAQAEALLNGITPGEWVADYFGDGMYALSGVKPGTLDEDLQNIGVFKTGDGYGRSADCALMMAAPTLARQVVELAEKVTRLRAGMQALQDWAVRERDEAWATEKVAVEQGIIPGPLDWPHRKGAALLNVVGRISQILNTTQEARHDD